MISAEGFPNAFIERIENRFWMNEAIDPDMLDEEMLRIRQCLNEMDNVLSEMDEREPGTFYELAEEIGKFIDNR